MRAAALDGAAWRTQRRHAPEQQRKPLRPDSTVPAACPATPTRAQTARAPSISRSQTMKGGGCWLGWWLLRGGQAVAMLSLARGWLRDVEMCGADPLPPAAAATSPALHCPRVPCWSPGSPRCDCATGAHAYKHACWVGAERQCCVFVVVGVLVAAPLFFFFHVARNSTCWIASFLSLFLCVCV